MFSKTGVLCQTILWTSEIFEERHIHILGQNLLDWQPGLNEILNSEDDKKELFIVNEDTSGKKTLQVIRKTIEDESQPSTNELHYGAVEIGNIENNDNVIANLTFDLLAEHVSDIKMQLVTTTGEDGLLRVKQVKVTLTMEQNNITYTIQKTIALRNQPLGTYRWTLSE